MIDSVVNQGEHLYVFVEATLCFKPILFSMHVTLSLFLPNRVREDSNIFVSRWRRVFPFAGQRIWLHTPGWTLGHAYCYRVILRVRFLRSCQQPSQDPFACLLPARIEEPQQQPLPDGYFDHLRLKLPRLALAARPDVQKTTFSDDR